MSPPSLSLRQLLFGAGLALVMALASVAFDNPNTQQLSLTSTFFSGAANLEWGRRWLYDRDDAERFNEITDRAQRDAYRFQRSDDLEPVRYQEVGYVYVAWVARKLFFWQGDLKAAESFQVLTHIVITLCLLAFLKRPLSRALFFVLYGVNPLILYFATFPLYYYWQTLPTALLLPYLLDRSFRYGRLAPLVVLGLAFSYVVRPSMLFVLILLFVLMMLRERRPIAGLSALTAAACVALVVTSVGAPRKNPWHSAYIGIGAYPNPYMEGHLDRYSYDRFERETGSDARRLVRDNSPDEELWRRYSDWTREKYLEILRESPLLLVRNAALNGFESFSLGYVVGNPKATYASALMGFVVCAVLLVRRQWLFALAIVLGAASIAPYHPPVPAYIYGNYILVIGGMIRVSEDLPFLQRGFGAWLARLRREPAPGDG